MQIFIFWILFYIKYFPISRSIQYVMMISTLDTIISRVRLELMVWLNIMITAGLTQLHCPPPLFHFVLAQIFFPKAVDFLCFDLQQLKQQQWVAINYSPSLQLQHLPHFTIWRLDLVCWQSIKLLFGLFDKFFRLNSFPNNCLLALSQQSLWTWIALGGPPLFSTDVLHP